MQQREHDILGVSLGTSDFDSGRCAFGSAELSKERMHRLAAKHARLTIPLAAIATFGGGATALLLACLCECVGICVRMSSICLGTYSYTHAI